MNPTTVIIFGVFDGIHEGHMAFIKEAMTHGDRVVAVVARDSVVEKLKGKMPSTDQANRIHNLSEVPGIDIVYLGDPEEGTYNVIKEIKPNIIFLGYDQKELGKNISEAIAAGTLSDIADIDIKFGTPHQPEKFKSSIINNEKNN